MADVSAEFVENCGFELLRTEYTPPEGYRVLQIGEVVQKDDIFLAVNGEHWPAKRIGETVNNNRYIRRIEVEQAEPQPEPQPENCGFEGKILYEVPQPCDTPPEGWQEVPSGEPLKGGDEYHAELNRYLRRIEPQPEPIRVREGRWRTRGGDIRDVKPTPECDNRHDRFPWRDTAYDQTWAVDGRYFVDREESPLDLEEYLGPIEQQPEPQPVPEHMQAIIAAQAETIARLQSDVHELNMEIGGLQGDLSRRQARIRDLETLHAAASQAVVRADKANDKLRAQADDFRSEIHYVQKELGEARAELAGAIQSRDAFAAANREQADKLEALQARICVSEIRRNETLREQLDAATADLQKRHPDHVGRAISTEEWMGQFARDASVSRLQADRNDLAGKVIVLREQLQQANDRLAFLETLQPIAAACHTAQTMVRDMLGHMRCLLALQHTTDRRDSCTLLESILEVFDEAECDDGDNDEADSEAGQG